jgi:hypothetical protein
MQSMMRSVTGSASEFAFAVSVMALKAMGKQLPFLTDEDNRKINEIRVCITSKK